MEDWKSYVFYYILVFSFLIIFAFPKEKLPVQISFFVIIFAVGLSYVQEKIKSVEENANGARKYAGTAFLYREPEVRDNFRRIYAELESGEKILINQSLFPEYDYGDIVKLGCQLEKPDQKFKMSLAKDKIHYVCRKAEIEIVGKGKGNFLYAGIIKFKNKINQKINEMIPYPYSGLLSGVLLGGNSGLPQSVRDDFSRTGMSHIVAVSGYNVTVIAEYLTLFGIFIGLWRKQAFWFAVLGIGFFVLMIGLPSSAVRAAVMGTLLLWAMKNGRLANSKNAIAFSAAVMLSLNPLLLRWDIGFQLSFLASLGIILVYPKLEIFFENKSGFAVEILLMTLAAQIMVFPVILHYFQNLSLISFLANVLVLPVIPMTMLAGFLMIVLGFIFPLLAYPLAWISYAFLKYEIEIIRLLSSLDWGIFEIKNFGVFWIMGSYLAVLLFLNRESVLKWLIKEN